MDPVIELRNVRIAFEGHEVLHGIDLTVLKGEILTIMGGSGSGKSVLLRLLAGLIKPDQGEICIDSTDTVPLSENEMLNFRQRMGVVFQQAALFDSMSVADNIAYPLREHARVGEDAVRQRVAELQLIVQVSETFGTTSIVVSHDLFWSLKISSRVALIYRGNIIAAGTPAEIQD